LFTKPFLCLREHNKIYTSDGIPGGARDQPKLEKNWNKLVKITRLVFGTVNNMWCYKVDNNCCFKCLVDASFMVYNDMKSHNGATMTVGKGVISIGILQTEN
jgi:hypothetical protein